jgi:glycosyltransferase involved in cell wall biosynthesis
VEVLTTDNADPETNARLVLETNPTRFPDGFEVVYTRRTFGQSASYQMLRLLPSMVRRAELVHLSMTYSFPTFPTLLLCSVFGKPVVWSPRGAIQATAEWSDAPRKRVKGAFEQVARVLAPRNTVLHVTSESEALATEMRMRGLEVVMVPNPVPARGCLPRREFRPGGTLRLLFLSRLHPKKGIDTLVEALAVMPTHVTLKIAGSGHPDFEDQLASRVDELGLASRVSFLGHLDGAAKVDAMEAADALVLPTHSENFGIAIAEGLAYGLPVITSTAAPWPGIVTHRCGLLFDPTYTSLVEALHSLDALTGSELAAMGARGHSWMQADFSEVSLGKDMMMIYDRLLRKTGASQ